MYPLFVAMSCVRMLAHGGRTKGKDKKKSAMSNIATLKDGVIVAYSVAFEV